MLRLLRSIWQRTCSSCSLALPAGSASSPPPRSVPRSATSTASPRAGTSQVRSGSRRAVDPAQRLCRQEEITAAGSTAPVDARAVRTHRPQQGGGRAGQQTRTAPVGGRTSPQEFRSQPRQRARRADPQELIFLSRVAPRTTTHGKRVGPRNEQADNSVGRTWPIERVAPFPRIP